MQLSEIVTHSANIFNSNELFELQQKLIDCEVQTMNQCVAVSIKQLGFETIKTYANGLFNQNLLCQKGKDKGLLILFSALDREVRI
jgi:uncharacterized protein